MTLPHAAITPIPNNEPDAVPSLWNDRYKEIDDNFVNHESRVGNLETEVTNGRGGKANLDARFDEIEANVAGLDPEFQNNLIAAVLASSDMAAMALRELERFRSVRIQEGEATIYNRGVVNGCVVTRKAANTRILSLAAGKFFAHGRDYSVGADTDATSVPPNSGGSTATCTVYLYIDGSGEIQCQCTPLNTAPPSDGVTIYTVSVPAGSTGDDGAFTLSDARRLCAGWPNVFDSAAYASVALACRLPDTNYGVHLDILSCEGGLQQIGGLEAPVVDRLTNGFKVYLAGSADAVRFRYTVRRMIP